MGFGSTYYGAGGFGSGVPSIIPPEEPGLLVSLQVLRQTQVLLTFLRAYPITEELLDPANYIIIQDGPSSANIEVVSVEAGNDQAAVTSVILNTQHMVSNVTYTVSAQNFVDTGGVLVDPLSEIEWPFYVTKVQTLQSKLPEHFDLRAQSTLTGVMTAIGLIDEAIGGNG